MQRPTSRPRPGRRTSAPAHCRRAGRRRVALAGVVCLGLLAAAPAVAFSPPNHEAITRQGLSFLAPSVLDEIAAGDLSQDTGFWDPKDPAHHFDSCMFTGTTSYIRQGYRDLTDSLNAGGRSTALARARHLGRILHPIQDFYSHANWVEHGRRDLLDQRPGEWRILHGWETIRDDLVVGEGESLPAGWSKHSGPPRSAVDTPDGERHVIITGYAEAPGILGWLVDDHCHDDLDFSHTQLNKDKAGITGFTTARRLAIRQTAHEWCRLLRLAEQEDGSAGPAALLGLWVRPGASAHPPGTACGPRPEPARAGVRWAMNVTAIRVKDPRNDGAAGQINLRTVLYARSLRGSTVAGIGPVTLAPGQALGADGLPRAQRLCVGRVPRPVVVAVQGWRDDDGGRSGVLDHRLFAFSDDVLDGVSLTIQRPGRYTMESPDMIVSFDVRRARNCLDDKGKRE